MGEVDVKELQESFNNLMKTIKDNGLYVDNGIIKKIEYIYVLSVDGIFHIEYLGDGDSIYKEISGDIILSDEEGLKIINQIVDANHVTSENEDSVIEVSKIIGDKLTDCDSFLFDNLYAVEYSEFYNLSKTDDSVSFHEKSEDKHEFKCKIHKKPSDSIIKFKIEQKVGCVLR